MYYKLRFSKPVLGLALLISIWTVYFARLFLRLDLKYLLILGLIVLLFCTFIFNIIKAFFQKAHKRFNRNLDNLPIEMIVGGTTGLLVGIIVAALSSFPLALLGKIGAYITMIFFILTVYLGLKIGLRKAQEVYNLFPFDLKLAESHYLKNEQAKILDTSAIIDGRIYDVCISHFLQGPLIVPNFVIEELQHIADSSDNIRRNKGRRGLELLTKMQKHTEIKIVIIDVDEPSILEEKEVDNKLIRLCKHLNASIITNDYNLNKVAELQGITVLNINELTNAVKVIVYPGETMNITIIKEGKEAGQGVGYLEDGTMVVVEEAQKEIGRDLEVMVTSVFQTAAGRMIFTRKVREDSRHSASQPLDMQEVNMYG
ncbi:MAG TPA: TRAM domain-containing protein [Syntrophomonadaceae bacterium]|nr:TRAM domain-containing protein [Syntrophomonadaceae bacterium]HNX28102.1 TRAM domain-containing protein [Syntrophomonadaceae bacterium]HPR93495.1 TRAM domain-containing protein [Syntrophomonadaceae bacterium]